MKVHSEKQCLQSEQRKQPERKDYKYEFSAAVKADSSQTTHELKSRFGVTLQTILTHLIKKPVRLRSRKIAFGQASGKNCFEVFLSFLPRDK